MDILEALYEKERKRVHFYPRKQTILSKRTILKGPRKSGKSYIIFDHLNEYERYEYLYIDFNDLRVDKNLIKANLPSFLKQKPIKLLVLENFDFSFKLPSTQETIISTNKNIDLKNFVNQTIYPLDFEEFISFDKKQSNIEHIFSSFTDIGSFPQIVLSDKANFTQTLQELILSLIRSDLKFKIFKTFAISQSLKISQFQIFNSIKENHKISKDKFYEYTKKFEEENLLFFMNKFNHQHAAKKVFLIDPTIKSILTFQKDFIKRFENIIFLELIKHNKKAFYIETIDFFIPDENSAILPLPFLPIEMIKAKIERIKTGFLEYDIQKVQIITLENEASFDKDGITYEILPFWNWALQL